MKVWDIPTRLFHWAIVLLIAGAWYSAEAGPMEWHYRAGIGVLGLIAFRLLWGVIGSRTARFAYFLHSPRAVADYVRGRSSGPPRAGHNPLGGYSVIAMLVVLVVQVSTGVFAVDVDGIESGPLSNMVSFDDGRLAAEIHDASFVAIQGLVGLHLLALAFYWLRGRRLVLPMITGRDPQLGKDAQEIDAGGGKVRASIAVAAASVFAWWVSAGAPL